MAEKEKPKSQVEKFRDLARKIGADESEEPLNEALRRVGAKAAIPYRYIPWPKEMPPDSYSASETEDHITDDRHIERTVVRRILFSKDGTIIGDEMV